MIVKLNKAILHICNTIEGIAVYSKSEMDISDASVNSYINAHIEKAFGSAKLKKGSFTKNSGCCSAITRYLANEQGFVELSQAIATRFYESMCECSDMENFDIVIAEFIKSDENYLAILKLDSKAGFSHQIIADQDSSKNVLVSDLSVIPTTRQSISEFAFINENTLDIHYASKKHTYDGEKIDIMAETILECICEAVSSKEVVNTIKTLIKKVSDTPFESVANMVNAKNAIINEGERQGEAEGSTYSFEQVADKTFKSPAQRNVFLEDAKKCEVIFDNGDKLEVDAYTIKKLNEKVRIVADNGFEVKLLATLFDKDNGMRIITNEDGTVTFELNGILNYELK